jgi:hypothetical protein
MIRSTILPIGVLFAMVMGFFLIHHLGANAKNAKERAILIPPSKNQIGKKQKTTLLKSYYCMNDAIVNIDG